MPSMSPPVDAAIPLASRFVRSLLLRHKVPAMRHVTCVAEILSFTYTQVHRRMNGGVAWEIEEIEKVGAHFGEELHEVFAQGKTQGMVPGWLVLDGGRVLCQIALGEALSDVADDTLVAIWDGSLWTAGLAASRPAGSRHAVARLQVIGATGPKQIAVLDDDEDEAKSLADFFVLRGCEAEAFSTMEALVAKTAQRRYDAYILDWIIGDRSAMELIAMLRSGDNTSPIAILTGKVGDSRIERDVAEALSTYRLMFFEKPTRPPLVASQILQALAPQ